MLQVIVDVLIWCCCGLFDYLVSRQTVQMHLLRVTNTSLLAVQMVWWESLTLLHSTLSRQCQLHTI